MRQVATVAKSRRSHVGGCRDNRAGRLVRTVASWSGLPDTKNAIQSCEQGFRKIYVTVALKPEYPTISSAEQRTAQHAEAQADLLSLFETGEFEDSYLSNRALVYGHVSAIQT